MDNETQNLMLKYGFCRPNTALGCLHPGKCGSEEAVMFAEEQRLKQDQE